MKIKKQIEKNFSVNMACTVPLHLYRRLCKQARETQSSKSKVLRDILSEKYGYISKQHMHSRGKKIYLYRKDKDKV